MRIATAEARATALGRRRNGFAIARCEPTLPAVQEEGMRRFLLASLAFTCLSGCTKEIEVQSDTSWVGVVNNADVAGSGYTTYALWDNAPSFYFRKATSEGYLAIRFKQGKGDEPETTAPYGSIWGTAW